MKMKSVLLGLAVVMASTSLFAANVLYWYSTEAGLASEDPDIYRPDSTASVLFDGAKLTVADAYYIALLDYSPSGADLLSLRTHNAFTDAGKVPLAVRSAASESALGAQDSGQFYDESLDFLAWEGKTLHTVIISQDPAAIVGTSAVYAFYTFPVTATLSWTIAPPTFDYDIGQKDSSAVLGSLSQTAWTVVPEPSSALFALVGVGTILYRRLRKKD